jgi:hypothetical protein
VIVNVICDDCQEAVARVVVYETKWKQYAVCKSCLKQIDLDTVYDVRGLVVDIKATLAEFIPNRPDMTTPEWVKWFMENTAIPVFLAPFDTAVKEALRDRSMFRGIRVGRLLRYELVRDEPAALPQPAEPDPEHE